jgi:hypothetical protein
MSDHLTSKTQAAAQWLRDLAHRITLYDVDERRLREIATEFERVQRELDEAEAELERRQAKIMRLASEPRACKCKWYAPIPAEWRFCPTCGGPVPTKNSGQENGNG